MVHSNFSFSPIGTICLKEYGGRIIQIFSSRDISVLGHPELKKWILDSGYMRTSVTSSSVQTTETISTKYVLINGQNIMGTTSYFYKEFKLILILGKTNTILF